MGQGVAQGRLEVRGYGFDRPLPGRPPRRRESPRRGRPHLLIPPVRGGPARLAEGLSEPGIKGHPAPGWPFLLVRPGHAELAGGGAQAPLGRGIVLEGGKRGAQRLAGAVAVVEHHARAHQPDPAVGVARILAQPVGEPVDHAAHHRVLLARRDAAGGLHLLPRRPRNGRGRGRAEAAGAGGRRPEMSISLRCAMAVTASRTCGCQTASAGASRSRAISSSTAARWSPRRSFRWPGNSAPAVAGLQLEHPAQQPLGLGRRRIAALEQQASAR